MSTRDKIAQLVMPWIAGSYAAFDDKAFERMQKWVDELHVGGLIVSVGSPLDMAAKLNRLQERSPLPLLIGSDLEGGTSIRFNGGTPLPPNMGVAASGSDSAAYEMGRITAVEARAVGIHLVFAPVADVNNNPDNPIINTRSFGEDPARRRPDGRGRGARAAGSRRARHRETLPGPRRHRHRLAHRAAGHRARAGRGSTPSSWYRSARDRRRRGCGDVRAHRAAGPQRGRSPARHRCCQAS